MTVATLRDVLDPAARDGYAVAGLVVLGWEDALAYVAAAEDVGAPVILQAGPGCRAHTPLRVLGAMFRHLAEQADVPVVCHLDHGYAAEDCLAALEHGFTSVMFDGSKLPIEENVEITARIVGAAHAAGVSVEGEVGHVGYAEGAASAPTSPEEAGRFERETGVDALAVSVGNVHLQTERLAEIDFTAVRAIENATSVPLVLHGGSGIAPDVRGRLARETRVSKFNIGTELRMAFGEALRRTLKEHPARFDRLQILGETIAPLQGVAARVIREIRAPS